VTTRLPTSADEVLDELVRASLEHRSGSADATQRERLVDLTQRLIKLRVENGELSTHPYTGVWTHPAPIGTEVADYIRGRRVLVTGAGGCIGTALSKAIASFQPAVLAAVDNDPGRLGRLTELVSVDPRLVDIADFRALDDAWREVRPEVVFHLAAERQAWLAEERPRLTIATNMLGTRNTCLLAVKHGPERFIYASTAKCRHIYDERIYPATKQFAEFDVYCQSRSAPQIRWSCVRFHHVVDNSIVEWTFKAQIRDDAPLTVHLPLGRSKHGQSADEAVAMLLNSSILADGDAEVFASRSQLDQFYPLDLALYLIKESGKELPIVFYPPRNTDGYHLYEFPGLRRPPSDDGLAITHAFNTIQTDLDTLTILPELQMVWTPFPEFDEEVARRCSDAVIATTEPDPRAMTYANLWTVAETVFARAPVRRLVEALRFGLTSELLADDRKLARQEAAFRLLLDALLGRANSVELAEAGAELNLLAGCSLPEIAERAQALLERAVPDASAT